MKIIYREKSLFLFIFISLSFSFHLFYFQILCNILLYSLPILEIPVEWPGVFYLTHLREVYTIFCTVSFIGSNFFLNLCFIPMYSVLIHFHNAHTFTYQKALLYSFFACLENRRKPSVYP